jgi:hypothetical protein
MFPTEDIFWSGFLNSRFPSFIAAHESPNQAAFCYNSLFMLLATTQLRYNRKSRHLGMKSVGNEVLQTEDTFKHYFYSARCSSSARNMILARPGIFLHWISVRVESTSAGKSATPG